MGSSGSVPVPPRKPVPAGKTRICIAGFTLSTHTGRARRIIGIIAKKYPDKFESWMYFASGKEYYAFLKQTFDDIPFPPHLKGHDSSPFVWLEHPSESGNRIEPIGGRSHLCEWVGKTFPEDKELKALLPNDASVLLEAFHNGSGAPQSTADVSL